MGLQRFYVPQLPTPDLPTPDLPTPDHFSPDQILLGRIALDEAEARHASQVLRLKVGDEVLAFDGCGGEARCKVALVSKREVELEVVERLDRECELPCELHLIVALPKGDRQKTLADHLVQLGVSSLSPLITERGVAQPVDAALGRLSRSVIESSKQCGRNRLMGIGPPVSVSQLSATPVENKIATAPLQLFAHPYGDVTPLHQLADRISAAAQIRVLIGPEGGFTEQEADQLRRAGWTAVSLGPRILRVEVAAGHVASWIAECPLAFTQANQQTDCENRHGGHARGT